MKILHTSDWHLGRILYQHKRYSEFGQFLAWLLDCINEQQIDALLIAGDIFDTTNPTHAAQQLYYQFLADIKRTCCRHVVIIAGNHDSPSLLAAPKHLLQALDIHVVGAISERLTDELIPLCNAKGELEALVCAVPYLRDRDIRSVEAGESVSEKGEKLLQGIKAHYAAVCALAEQYRAEQNIPLIVMGHLFTSGAELAAEDGVRELYVGSLAHVDAATFPSSVDYLALGHLHVPQKVLGREHWRYSGSPLAMGFNEAQQTKSVVIVEFNGREASIHLQPIPCFQVLRKLSGSILELEQEISALRGAGSDAWLDIEYKATDWVGDLLEQVHEWVQGSCLQVLRVRNRQTLLNSELVVATELLSDLNPTEVFQRCLTANQVSADEQAVLQPLYQQVLQTLHEADKQAE